MTNHYLALVTTCAVSAVVIAPQALAQTNFPFNGVIAPFCGFEATPTTGVLVLKTTSVNNDTLTSFDTGGSPSTANLTCNTTTSNVSVAAPAPSNALATGLNSVAAGTFANAQGFSFFGVLGSVNIFSNGTDNAAVGIVNSVTYTVHMEFQADSTIPAGTYSFNIPLTAAPN
jgi:hypothetical protein